MPTTLEPEIEQPTDAPVAGRSLQEILDATGLPRSARADLWDAYHSSATPADLQGKLDKINVPKEVKASLWDAKSGVAAPAATQPASLPAVGSPEFQRNLQLAKQRNDTAVMNEADAAVQNPNPLLDAAKPGEDPRAVFGRQAMGTAHDIVAGTAGLLAAPSTPAEQVLASVPGGAAVIAAKRAIVDPSVNEIENGATKLGGVPIVGPMAAHMGRAAGAGNYVGAVADAAQLAAMTPELAESAVTHVVPKVASVASDTGALVKAGATAVAEVPKKAAAVMMPEKFLGPEDAITRAVKPRNTNTRWPSDIKTALSDVKAVEQAPVQNIDDMLDLIPDAKKRVWAEVEKLMAPAKAAGATVDGNSVADAMVDSIDKYTRLHEPDKVAAIEAKADNYRNPISLEDAEDLIHSLNKREAMYYAKNRVAQRQALGDPDTAASVAEAAALRGAIADRVSDFSGPGLEEAKQRYGALSNLESELWNRRNVAARQAPQSLSEQMGAWRAAGKMASGAKKIATLDVRSGLADIAEGTMNNAVARHLKEVNGTDNLIRIAMEKTPVPAPSPAPLAPQIAGLLPPAAIPLQPADIMPGNTGKPVAPAYVANRRTPTGSFHAQPLNEELPAGGEPIYQPPAQRPGSDVAPPDKAEPLVNKLAYELGKTLDRGWTPAVDTLNKNGSPVRLTNPDTGKVETWRLNKDTPQLLSPRRTDIPAPPAGSESTPARYPNVSDRANEIIKAAPDEGVAMSRMVQQLGMTVTRARRALQEFRQASQ